MYVKRSVSPSIIYYLSWRTVLFSFILSSIVFLLYKVFGWHKVAIPFLPIATIGTAVAFYVGFKNNSSYDRLWEARKIWGEIVNLSRSVVSYLLAVANQSDEPVNKSAIQKFVYRQIAFANMIRLQLRKRNVWDETHLYTQLASQCFPCKTFEQDTLDVLSALCCPEEGELLLPKQNIAKELVFEQMKDITKFKDIKIIDDFEHSDLMRMCTELYGQQGKSERIKFFPFPRQYAYFSEIFVRIFICLLPFGLIAEFAKLNEGLAWLTIPFSMLISWIFDTMEQIGDTSENPFENGVNDVPMTAICRTIERDLRELLGETDLPEPIQSIEGILM
jgi:putative membrane protein